MPPDDLPFGQLPPQPDPAEVREHKLQCLSEHICNIPSLERRRATLMTLEATQGKPFTDELKQRITREWERRQQHGTDHTA